MTTVSEREGFAQSVLNAARENPVSTALIGMGALWMFTGGNRVSALGRALDAGRDAVSHVGSSLSGASSAMQRHAGDAGSAVAGAVGNTVSEAADGLSGAAASLRGGIGGASGGSAAAVERARAGAAQSMRTVGDGARDIAGSRAGKSGRPLEPPAPPAWRRGASGRGRAWLRCCRVPLSKTT